MASGLRRCRGKRGSPRATSSSAFAEVALPSFPDSAPRVIETKEDRDSEATPEDVVKLFTFFDMDGNGMIDRKELADVLSSLDRAYWTMKRIRALFRAADMDRDQFISWKEFCTWVFARGEEQQIVRSAVPALEAKIAAEQAAAEAEKVAVQELRSTHEASLVASETISALAAALTSAEAALAPFFGADELQEHRERLERMQLPFEVVVMTIAGGEFRVKVTRQQSVASFCQEVAKLLDRKAYRILLAHERGRLEPPMATLEECGVQGPMQLAAHFGEADPLLEVSLSEFLALLLEYKLATQKEIEVLQQEFSNGKTSDEDIRNKFKKRVIEAETERRRKEEEEENQRKAIENRRIGMLEQSSAQVEYLPDDVFLEQALQANIVQEGEAVPEEHRDSLLEQLVLVYTINACKGVNDTLLDKVRDDQFECDKLASEAQARRASAQALMDECLPVFESAIKALNNLKLDDIREIKRLKCPPLLFMKTLEAVAAMFELTPVKKTDPSCSWKKVDDWWATAQKELFSDPQRLLNDLLEYDKDNICPKVIMRLKSYIQDETYNVATISKLFAASGPSRVCVAFHLWIHAAYKYDFAAKASDPIKMALREKEAELKEAMSRMEMHQQEQQPVLRDLEYFQVQLQLKLDAFQKSKE